MKRPLYNAIRSLFLDPRHFVAALLYRFGGWIPDLPYVKIIYWLSTRERLNLDNPRKFNEKLQWLKLYNQRPEYTAMADKIAVKDIVKKLIGVEYVIPTLRVYENINDIQWDELPNEFVLKTNHDSGGNGVIICRDKSIFSISRASKQLRKSLDRNSFVLGREWPYKNIEKKIFVEKYLSDNKNIGLNDYKFYCFNGHIKALFVCSDRADGKLKINYFDENFNPLQISQGHQQNAVDQIIKPDTFEEMKKLAEKLSTGIPHVRVDFYNVNGKVYFSEFTFFDSGGLAPFSPDEWNYLLGDCIILPEKYVEQR